VYNEPLVKCLRKYLSKLVYSQRKYGETIFL